MSEALDEAADLREALEEALRAELVPDAEPVRPSEELGAVTRRVAGPLSETVARCVRDVLAGRMDASTLEQLDAVLASLERLWAAAGETEHARTAAEIHRSVARAREGLGKGTGRARLADALRAFVPRFADALEPAAAERMRAILSYDEAAVPLFAELAAIPGIGARRLARLYGAGLHSVEVVSASDPRELAAVTGLPRALSEEVVASARRFAREAPRRRLAELRARMSEFHALAAVADGDPALAALVRDAVAQMRQLVETIAAREDG